MTVQQAVAAVALWRSRRFDTKAIAELLHLAESDIANLLSLVHEHEVGADRFVLQIIEGGAA